MESTLIILGVLLLVDLGIFFLMKPSKGKVRTTIGKVVSILLSLELVVGTIYVAKGGSTISNITGANTQIVRYNVVVLKDNKDEKLSDLKGRIVEINLQVETKRMNEAVKAL